LELNQHRSTIYREFKRNHTDTDYDSLNAKNQAKKRSVSKSRKIEQIFPAIVDHLAAKLADYWLPE